MIDELAEVGVEGGDSALLAIAAILRTIFTSSHCSAQRHQSRPAFGFVRAIARGAHNGALGEHASKAALEVA